MQVEDRNAIDKAATQILHPGSRILFRYWEALRAERPCPRRDEIELSRLTAVLPHVSIIERSEGEVWYFRHAGTQVCALLQAPVTGQNALEGFDRFESDVVSNTFKLAVTRLQPCLVRLRLMAQAETVTAVELLGLPVQNQISGRVQLFGGLFEFGSEGADHHAPLVRRELVSARIIWTEHHAGDRLMDSVGHSAPRLRVIQGGLS